jgi:hypothetical protein
VHARDSHGSTPLHFASSSGHVDSVGVLLDAEAEVDTADAYERTRSIMPYSRIEMKLHYWLMVNGITLFV